MRLLLSLVGLCVLAGLCWMQFSPAGRGAGLRPTEDGGRGREGTAEPALSSLAVGDREDGCVLAGRLVCAGRGTAGTVTVRRLPVGFDPDSQELYLLEIPEDRPPEGAAEAGPDGEFTIRGLAPGIHAVIAKGSAGGIKWKRVTLPSPGVRVFTILALDVGSHTVSGIAVWPDGRPFQGLMSLAHDKFGWVPAGGREVPTSPEGRFRIERAHAGTRRLSARVPGEFLFFGPLVRIPTAGEIRVVVGRGMMNLRGRVVEDRGGGPVPGVTVSCDADVDDASDRWSFTRTTTDEEGNFVLPNLPGDRYLKVSKPGYRRLEVDLYEDRRRELTIRLERSSALSGRVTAAEDGHALAGVSVHVLSTVDNGPANLQASAVTDALGRYRIEDVPFGEGMVYVLGGGWASLDLSRTSWFGQNPLVRRFPAGESVTVNLAAVRAVRALGTVCDENGEALAGVPVNCRPQDIQREIHRNIRPETTDAGGRFEFDSLVPEVSYRFWADPAGRPGRNSGVVRGASGECLTVRIELEPVRFIDLIVTEKEGGGPIADVDLRLRVAGVSRDRDDWRTDAAGRARVGPIPPGDVLVYATHPEFQRQTATPHLAPSMKGPVRIELEAGVAIEGRVLFPDGTPAVGGRVDTSVRLPDGRSSGSRGSQILADGTFRLPGLSPGVYALSARSGRDHRMYYGSAEVETLGGPVTILLLEEADSDPEVSLRVRVLDPAGRPVPRCQVYLCLDTGRSDDEDYDSFETEGEVTSGVCELRVPAEGYRRATLEVLEPRTLSGERLPHAASRFVRDEIPVSEWVVHLRGGLEITGVVMGPSGEAVPGAVVWANAEAPPEFVYSQDARTRTGADGTFRLSGLMACPYTLEVQPVAPYVHADETAPIPAGTEDVEIRLDVGMEVRVTLRDERGEPVPGATATSFSGTSRTTSDQNGVMVIRGVSPEGRFNLRVQPPWDRRELLPIDVTDVAPADMELRFETGLEIAGVVKDPAGNPAPKSMVWAKGTEKYANFREIRPFVDGTFRGGPFPAGTVEVTVLPLGFRPRQGGGVWREILKVPAGKRDLVLTHDDGADLIVAVSGWTDRYSRAGRLVDETTGECRGATLHSNGRLRMNRLRSDRTFTLIVTNLKGGVIHAKGLRPSGGATSVEVTPGHVIRGRILEREGDKVLGVYAVVHGMKVRGLLWDDGDIEIRNLPEGAWPIEVKRSRAGIATRVTSDPKRTGGEPVVLDLRER